MLLKGMKERSGFTYKELSEKTGIPLGTISSIVSNDAREQWIGSKRWKEVYNFLAHSLGEKPLSLKDNDWIKSAQLNPLDKERAHLVMSIKDKHHRAFAHFTKGKPVWNSRKEYAKVLSINARTLNRVLAGHKSKIGTLFSLRCIDDSLSLYLAKIKGD